MDIIGVHFAAFSYMFYVLFFIVGIVYVLYSAIRLQKIIKGLVTPKWRSLLLKNFSLGRLWLKAILLCSALVALFLVLLRPQWGKKDKVVAQEGRDLVIILDISRSMLAQDLIPNRLTFAKLKIRALLDMLSFERVGLILFSGSAYIQCPLTSDYGAFLSFLKHVDVETISSGSTSLSKAFEKMIELFSAAKNRKNKLALLLSDGEDFSQNFGVMKEAAKKEDIKLFALGIGTPEGAPIPILDSVGKVVGHETDSNGKIALSKLNNDLLAGICSLLNGFYTQASRDDSDLETIVRLIEKFEKERFEERKLSLYEDRYFYFAAAAFCFLILEWIL